MSEGMAEAREALAATEVDEHDVAMLSLALHLRTCAEQFPQGSVMITMTPLAARGLAYDLEELAMLRNAPPTGDAG
jgi:hypothetical protein